MIFSLEINKVCRSIAWAKAFPQSQISENGGSEQLFRYSGEDYLLGIPTRNNLARENDNEGLTAILYPGDKIFHSWPFIMRVHQKNKWKVQLCIASLRFSH